MSYIYECIPEASCSSVNSRRINVFKSIINKWAGLRNFVKDKSPVIGYDSQIENFFWISGQGGYGIQTSPALAKIASNLILNKSNELYEKKYKIDLASLNIKRLI